MYCTLAMEQKVVLFGTYLYIFTFVLTNLCLRNDLYFTVFLLCESNISIISISCYYDAFKFFWSCPTFFKNFSLFLIMSFTIIFDFTSCDSVLVISWWRYNPVSVFTFISSVLIISSFTSASPSWMIVSIWYPVFFLFYIYSIYTCDCKSGLVTNPFKHLCYFRNINDNNNKIKREVIMFPCSAKVKTRFLLVIN